MSTALTSPRPLPRRLPGRVLAWIKASETPTFRRAVLEHRIALAVYRRPRVGTETGLWWPPPDVEEPSA